MINSVDIVSLQILQHVLAIVGEMTSVDQHRLTSWPNDERTH